MTLWKNEQRVQTFLSGTRAALPLAQEQLAVMQTLIRAALPGGVQNFLDLGCGSGVLGQVLFSDFPQAQGVFVDFSEPMLNAARRQLSQHPATILHEDFSTPAWLDSVQAHAPFDLVVSGYAIHHLPDERKQTLYQEIYGLLRAGGLFINVEHVASPDQWVERLFEQAIVDGLHQQQPERPRAEIEQAFYATPDDADICAPVEMQCYWLRKIGFEHVDCYMKIFALAVFGGIKP